MIEDYYQILGVSNDATTKEIKTAYRKLARKFHPDVGGSTEQFVLLKKAYETLSNNLSRRKYDLQYDFYRNQQPTHDPRDWGWGSENRYESSERKTTEPQQYYSPQHDFYTYKRQANREEESQAKKGFSGYSFFRSGIWKFIAFTVIMTNVFVLITFINSAYLANNEPEGKAEINALEEDVIEFRDDFVADTWLIEDQELQSSDSYFTYGDTKNTVSKIMGPPKMINGDTWWYGDSYVWFVDGKVSGWENSNRDLKVEFSR